MIFPDDEVANGLERLSRYPEARYLKQVLLTELLKVSGQNQKAGAVRVLEGRRSFADELIKKLKFEPQKNDAGPDATELIRRPAQRERAESRSERRLAAAKRAFDDAGDPKF